MDTTVGDILPGLKALAPLVSNQSTLPATLCVLVSGNTMTATNLEAWATCTAEVETDKPFPLPGEDVIALLTDLPSTTPISLTVQGRTLTVKTADREAVFDMPEPDGFPPAPSLDAAKTFELPAAPVMEALDQALPYAATEDSRPVLEGVCWDLAEGRMAAADGYRLAVIPVPVVPAHDAKLLIPRDAARHMLRLWNESKGPLQVEYANFYARFTCGSKNLTTSLTQGTFPKYKQLIPTQHTQSVVLGAEALRKAVIALAPMTKKGSGIVRLQWQGKVLTVSARAEKVGRVALNQMYLSVLLTRRTGPVTMHWGGGPANPVLCEFGDQGGAGAQFVFMPMFVQWNDKRRLPESEDYHDHAHL